jgi:lysophospholipase
VTAQAHLDNQSRQNESASLQGGTSSHGVNSAAYIRAPDSTSLRVARYHGQGASRGTVVVCMGFAETIEKYSEVVDELRARAFDVVVFDWRGQGLSARRVRVTSKGHIDDFSLYERDLIALEAQVLQPFCPRPWFALAHSMGGAVVLAQAAHHTSPFERMVLCAPMIAFAHHAHNGFERFAIELADLGGCGGLRVPFTRRYRARFDRFDDNVLTSDQPRFARWQKLRAGLGKSDIVVPTIGWVHAAFRQMDEFINPEYARHIYTPILVFAAGDDEIIDTRAVERFASRLKAGRAIALPYARHEILHERDDIRALFWAGFDAFIPGTTGA